MFTPQGKFGWYELMTSDTETAGRFYADVVGWSVKKVEAPGYEGPAYTTFDLGDTGIAGMLTIPGHTAWVGYVSVEDVDAHVEKMVEAGGKMLRPAVDVPGMLRFAVMADPQGAAIVVFTPVPMETVPVRPESPTPGTVGWHELYTTDLEGSFEFYSRMFGWTKVTDMDMGAMGVYRIFDQGDGKQMGDGGMMAKGPHIPVPCWMFYFNVDAIRKAVQRVEAGGGKVLHGPVQVPGGGWTIQGQDPQGAMFALFSAKE